MTPRDLLEKLNGRLEKRHKAAFLGTVLLGLLIHLPVMLSDIPNHDGLASMYFDQNMITSGRWFLTVACGFSSYFTVPWVIGLLGLLFLGLTAMALTELLEIEAAGSAVVLGGMLAAFPALASTFAYVFTLDGYMMALLLSVMAVLLTKKCRLGFLWGAFCLAFSMGIYQAYLPFAILLCLYQVVILFADGAWKADKKALMKKVGAYLAMGILGFVFYYVILRILLLIQGKELASYQGIGEVGTANNEGLLSMVKSIYSDFASFTLGGGVFFQNVFSLAALLVLALVTICLLFQSATEKKWWKHPGFYGILLLLAVAIPPCTSCIRLVSPGLNYHLLMRYQWVLFPVLAYAFSERCLGQQSKDGKKAGGKLSDGKIGIAVRWALLLSAVTMIFCYGLADNIAYVNLEKKYEKTYAYCLRLLDRIEQTPGYYQGIPVALVGVVGEDPYPTTEITGKVTGNMIGLSGDWLFYTGDNYEAFIKNYLGATLNIVDVETMGEIYYSPEYVAMESFPAQGSTKVVNGVLYVKTENSRRD